MDGKFLVHPYGPVYLQSLAGHPVVGPSCANYQHMEKKLQSKYC